MKDVEWLRANYVTYLDSRQKSFQDNITKLSEQNRGDEANFERIRLNVVGIFAQMFRLSLNDDPQVLKEKYLRFFTKITNPWHENREKALEFGEEVEKMIEDIKIQKANELKKCFEEYFNQLDANQGCMS